MENTRTECVIAAKALRAEKEKLSAFLQLPEVSSDSKLTAHYRRRIRLLEPVLLALERYETESSEDALDALEREMILLSVAQHDSSLAYAGAGAYICANYKDSDLSDVLTALEKKLPEGSIRVIERSQTLLRVECDGQKAYDYLSALGKGALGENVEISVYPILPVPDIREEDVRTDIFLNGGKGGQNVNKVETAVRMTHLPTGVTVTCRDERSQLQNKKRAARLLTQRVKEYFIQAQSALVEKAKKEIK